MKRSGLVSAVELCGSEFAFMRTRSSTVHEYQVDALSVAAPPAARCKAIHELESAWLLLLLLLPRRTIWGQRPWFCWSLALLPLLSLLLPLLLLPLLLLPLLLLPLLLVVHGVVLVFKSILGQTYADVFAPISRASVVTATSAWSIREY